MVIMTPTLNITHTPPLTVIHTPPQHRDAAIERLFTATAPHPGAVICVQSFKALDLFIAIATSRCARLVQCTAT